jgi:hypothetical protein
METYAVNLPRNRKKSILSADDKKLDKNSDKNSGEDADVSKSEELKLVIDPDRSWIFEDEEDLFQFFKKDIEFIENKFKHYLSQAIENKTPTLEYTLDDPSEVWERTDLFLDERPVYTFIRDFDDHIEIAFCHCFEKEPVFIYSHFSIKGTPDLEDLETEFLVRDKDMREVFKGALEGDSLNEGDDLAIGLYKAMLIIRSEDDFEETSFDDFLEIRETTIEEADEIWRSMDSYGNNLVYFIKEFEDGETSDVFHYIAATLEDPVSDSNVLLFSFPTNDRNLLDRYRVGENLQTEEVSQEGSH